jgi:pentatricopeptide repeat protein
VIDQVVRIGGSRAQRDLQTNTLLAAYVNDGRLDDARAFLGQVDDRRPSRPIAGLGAS